MFTRSVNLVSSDEGFSVEVVGRSRVEYREVNRGLNVSAEMMVDGTIVIYTDSIKRWLPPSELQLVTPEEKARVIANIQRALEFAQRRFELDGTPEHTPQPLIKLPAPAVGILDLVGGKVAEWVKEDRQLLTRLFAHVNPVTAEAPQCDLLFLYVELTAAGALLGSRQRLRELIRDSGARIVVVASENPSQSYINAGTPLPPYGKANLVMTMQRNGTAFRHFFEALFSKMKRGVTMPQAWMELAPQHPGGLPRVDHPSTIFACELGPITFS